MVYHCNGYFNYFDYFNNNVYNINKCIMKFVAIHTFDFSMGGGILS